MKTLTAIVLIVVVVALVVLVLIRVAMAVISDLTIKSAKWVPMDPKVMEKGTLFQIEKRGQQPFSVAFVDHSDPDKYEKRSEAESLCIETCAEWNASNRLLRKWR